MKSAGQPSYPRAFTRKIVAAFALAIIAIALAFGITHFAFRDMLSTVEELSAPSGKLTLVNRAFQEITTLDQLQRAEALRNPKATQSAFLNHSQRTTSLIDSMLILDWTAPQAERIHSMKEILHYRDSLFFSYLKLKSSLIDNKRLTQRIDTLSSILEQKKIAIDSSIVTTEKRTTTTFLPDTVEPVKDERGFFGKIFGGKKKKAEEPQRPQIHVKEELSVTVDTVTIARQNQALEEVGKIVMDLEKDRRTQNKQLLSRELELMNANNFLVTQLLSILREVEQEEMEMMRDKSYDATIVVSESIKRMSFLLIAFFLIAALLVYLIAIDISKSNFYRLQLEKSRDEAQELSQIKQRFLANMSHEIRTPLQSIIGFAEHISREKKFDEEAVEAIYSSSEHLLHIVNEVLDYSRISSGHFTLANENFQLHGIVTEVESAMRIQAEKKKLSLIIDASQAEEYRLSGDSFRLRQILYNVMGNAVKFTSRGYVKLVVLAAEDNGKVNCEFIVSDTGIGIRKEDIAKIFNQFEQANTSIIRNYGGTGLGLTIVKSLIEAQGGTLTVESTPGYGSVFTIKLSFALSETQTPVEEEVAQEVVEAPPMKLLVVDDDPMILRLCGIILEKNSITHQLYDEAEKLYHEVPQEDVTHILMDIRMPKINGVELCKALKKKYPPQTRFIALTAHVFEQEKKQLYDQGFDLVLSKPFREEELLKALGVSRVIAAKEVIVEESNAIDLEPLRKMTMNDEALLQSVLLQYKEETSSDLKKLQTCLETKDLKMMREIVHKLAGRLGQMGLDSLSKQLRATETRIEGGASFEEVSPSVRTLYTEVNQITEKLMDLVSENTQNV